MQRKIRIKKELDLVIDGEQKRFHEGDEVELEENEARQLIHDGLALPSIQFSVGEVGG